MATTSTALKIGPTDHGRRMTMAEFLDAEEEPGYNYELGRGVLEVSEVPDDYHGEIIDVIHEAFSQFRRVNPDVIRWIGHGSDIRLRIPEMSSDRHPDLGIVLRGTPLDARGRHRPSLVIEVVSPGREAHVRDYVTKREEYLELGLLEYWIVDRLTHQVVVLSRTDSDEWSEQVFGDEDSIVSALLPGFEVRVSDLWVRADEESASDDE